MEGVVWGEAALVTAADFKDHVVTSCPQQPLSAWSLQQPASYNLPTSQIYDFCLSAACSALPQPHRPPRARHHPVSTSVQWALFSPRLQPMCLCCLYNYNFIPSFSLMNSLYIINFPCKLFFFPPTPPFPRYFKVRQLTSLISLITLPSLCAQFGYLDFKITFVTYWQPVSPCENRLSLINIFTLRKRALSM